jgi:hypothetical protein
MLGPAAPSPTSAATSPSGTSSGKADWNRIVAELPLGLHAPKQDAWVKIKNPPYS